MNNLWGDPLSLWEYLFSQELLNPVVDEAWLKQSQGFEIDNLVILSFILHLWTGITL